MDPETLPNSAGFFFARKTDLGSLLYSSQTQELYTHVGIFWPISLSKESPSPKRGYILSLFNSEVTSLLFIDEWYSNPLVTRVDFQYLNPELLSDTSSQLSVDTIKKIIHRCLLHQGFITFANKSLQRSEKTMLLQSDPRVITLINDLITSIYSLLETVKIEDIPLSDSLLDTASIEEDLAEDETWIWSPLQSLSLPDPDDKIVKHAYVRNLRSNWSRLLPYLTPLLLDPTSLLSNTESDYEVIDSSNKDNTELVNMISSLEEEIKNRADDKSSLEKTLNDKILSLEKNIKSQKQQIESLNVMLSDRDEQIQILEENLEESTDKNIELTAKIVQYSHDRDSMKSYYESMTTRGVTSSLHLSKTSDKSKLSTPQLIIMSEQTDPIEIATTLQLDTIYNNLSTVISDVNYGRTPILNMNSLIQSYNALVSSFICKDFHSLSLEEIKVSSPSETSNCLLRLSNDDKAATDTNLLRMEFKDNSSMILSLDHPYLDPNLNRYHLLEMLSQLESVIPQNTRLHHFRSEIMTRLLSS